MSQLFCLYMFDGAEGPRLQPVRSAAALQVYKNKLQQEGGKSLGLTQITGPLPMWAVWHVWHCLNPKLVAWSQARRRLTHRLVRAARTCLRQLRIGRITGARYPSDAVHCDFVAGAAGDGFAAWEEVNPQLERLVSAFFGRRLLEEEAVWQAWQLGIHGSSLPVAQLLEIACLLGHGQWRPGIVYKGGGQWQCSRCGEIDSISFLPQVCPICGSASCPICPTCSTMGQVRGCQPVYEFSRGLDVVGDGSEPRRSAGCVPLRTEPILPFRLTGLQAAAFRQLAEFAVSDSERRDCLVWAVCGAGKTEASFGAIAATVERGQRVLFAVPRREVVLELVPRIKAAFPTKEVTTLVGGQRPNGPLGQIVAATTHQALRLAPVFALVILDEADAFPYSTDPMLVRALHRCAAPQGKRITMTATPSAGDIGQVRAGRWELVVIPNRHHGQPLPVPKTFYHRSWAQNSWQDNATLFPPELEERVSQGLLYPLLIFVPAVKWGETLYTYLGRRWPAARMEYVYSGKVDNAQTKAALLRGELDVVVTTSVLSRGITIPGVNVLVARADAESVFSCASLVQMAGRAGRSPAQPTGEVWFLAAKPTSAMREAIDMIATANQKARQMAAAGQAAPA